MLGSKSSSWRWLKTKWKVEAIDSRNGTNAAYFKVSHHLLHCGTLCRSVHPALSMVLNDNNTWPLQSNDNLKQRRNSSEKPDCSQFSATTPIVCPKNQFLLKKCLKGRLKHFHFFMPIRFSFIFCLCSFLFRLLSHFHISFQIFTSNVQL